MPLTAHAKRRRDKDQRQAIAACARLANMGSWKAFEQLHVFAMAAAVADGPRMAVLPFAIEGAEQAVLRLWASNGKGTPVDRVAELRAALDAANARLRALGEQ